MLQYGVPLRMRADTLSALQNLGQPLTRVTTVPVALPELNPVPSQLDASLDRLSTRTKKCCKNPLPLERFSSEVYPIHADKLKDLRTLPSVFGAASRLDGRDPVAYRR